MCFYYQPKMISEQPSSNGEPIRHTLRCRNELQSLGKPSYHIILPSSAKAKPRRSGNIFLKTPPIPKGTVFFFLGPCKFLCKLSRRLRWMDDVENLEPVVTARRNTFTVEETDTDTQLRDERALRACLSLSQLSLCRNSLDSECCFYFFLWSIQHLLRQEELYVHTCHKHGRANTSDSLW